MKLRILEDAPDYEDAIRESRNVIGTIVREDMRDKMQFPLLEIQGTLEMYYSLDRVSTSRD